MAHSDGRVLSSRQLDEKAGAMQRATTGGNSMKRGELIKRYPFGLQAAGVGKTMILPTSIVATGVAGILFGI